MNQRYIHPLIQELPFSPDARTAIAEAMAQLDFPAAAEFQRLIRQYCANGYHYSSVKAQIPALSQRCRIPAESLNLLLLLSASEDLRAAYREARMPDGLFLETMSDLCCKAEECFRVHGVYGCFVSNWYDKFFSLEILKLGRLEYEISSYPWAFSYEGHGLHLTQGMPVKNLHIPSGAPLSPADCLASYQKAYDFFRKDLINGILVCVCRSWLLHKSTLTLLPAQGNTGRFIRSFQILQQEDQEEFHNGWRIFGAAHQNPPSELPEDTAMQRAFKKHLCQGGTVGSGSGILLFDGERVLTEKG